MRNAKAIDATRLHGAQKYCDARQPHCRRFAASLSTRSFVQTVEKPPLCTAAYPDRVDSCASFFPRPFSPLNYAFPRGRVTEACKNARAVSARVEVLRFLPPPRLSTPFRPRRQCVSRVFSLRLHRRRFRSSAVTLCGFFGRRGNQAVNSRSLLLRKSPLRRESRSRPIFALRRKGTLESRTRFQNGFHRPGEFLSRPLVFSTSSSDRLVSEYVFGIFWFVSREELLAPGG